MKKKLYLFAAAAVCLMASGCGPVVTAGPDVVVGGGIYPAPIPFPPPGPNVFRPGAPNGPGFRPGFVGNVPGGPGPVIVRPGGGPGNVGPGGPGGGPGAPGGGPGNGGPVGPGGPGGPSIQ